MTDLDPARLAGALRTARLGRAPIVLESCASTNDRAAALDREHPGEALLVVADAQTGGRGRQGRAWHSPPGQNLYFSLLLRPAAPAFVVPPLTLLAGAVLAEVVAATGVAPRLKWPNDLLIEAGGALRKAAGILTEMATERERVRHVVLGIGLNVNGTAFPDELADRATSLALATGRTFDRGALLASFLSAFEPAYDTFLRQGAAPALDRWRRFGLLGQRCRVERDGRVLEGIALDVDADGGLRLRDDAGQVHRIVSGVVA